MRLLILFCAALLLGAAQAAAEEPPCSPESKTPLVLSSWTAKPGKFGTEVQFALRNASGHAVKMNEALLFFTDALGNRVGIGGVIVPPDIVMENDAEAEVSVHTIGLERLLKADPADITATICTTALLTADGVKLEY
ncbi:hypothetical protein JP74_21300 [Devosia sp. 17-2-E-8]|nr:hypothetical protein JP74_21300 [Devosia sp. 17-2-E-8]